MDKPEFINSAVWMIVDKALHEYGAQLVHDMRSALALHTEIGKETAVGIEGALRAVDEMLALPQKLFSDDTGKPLSKDKPDKPIPDFNTIRRFS